MAIYFEFGNGEQVQVATNGGWGAVCRAVEKSGGGKNVAALIDTGEAESIAELAEEFAEVTVSDDSTQQTLAGIVDTLQSHEDQEDSLVVSDGMRPDDEPAEDDEDPDSE